MTNDEIAEAQATHELDQAAAVLARQQAIARQTQANDAELLELAQKHKVGMQPLGVLSVRLAALVEVLLGDESSPARLDYEEAVNAKFAEVIAGMREQVAEVELQRNRAALLNGVSGVNVADFGNNGRPR